MVIRRVLVVLGVVGMMIGSVLVVSGYAADAKTAAAAMPSDGSGVRFEVRVGSPPQLTPPGPPPETPSGLVPQPSQAPLPSAAEESGGGLPVTGGGGGWIGVVFLGGVVTLLVGGAFLWLVNARRRRFEA